MTYPAAFDKSVTLILKHEGGWVLDKDDPGGATKYGISQRAYPKLNIASLTQADAMAIYYRDYWMRLQSDSLAAGVALILFDMAVNMGVSRAVKTLQAACGVTADGVLGPMTILAANKLTERDLCAKMTSERVMFYAGLPTFVKFGKGWVRRSVETLTEAVT